MSTIDNVTEIAGPNSWERERQNFIGTLRRVVMVDLGGAMRKTWEETVEPKLEKRAENVDDVLAPMEGKRIFKFYSSARYNAQEMVFESVRPQVERNAAKISDAVEQASTVNPAGGSLKLNPEIEMPRYLTALDTHLIPGGFYREADVPNDAIQGALSTFGSSVFGSGIKNYNIGGPGATISNYLRIVHPEFQPKAIADLGCTAGRNSDPYVEMFPEAEVYGVDISAPLLRFGHARAEAEGKKIHFVQANAGELPFEDESLDFVTSAFFLHEIPVKLTKEVLAECYRVLKPGGLMMMFELPPFKNCPPYHNFYLDWDTWYNNEPAYAAYRSQDPLALSAEAGFVEEDCFEIQLLNWGTVPEDQFAEVAKGEKVVKPGWGGASWYNFGAWKK